VPPQKQDYLLRLMEELTRFLAEIRKLRDGGSCDAALHTILQAQQRLFARPAQEFMTRSLEEQVHLLVVGETAANAREKCLMYATLITEAGHTYQVREQTAVASGAYQLALHILLLTAHRFPGPDESDISARVSALLARVAVKDLTADVRALLNQFAGPAQPDNL
jgi:hypothetical protein